MVEEKGILDRKSIFAGLVVNNPVKFIEIRFKIWFKILDQHGDTGLTAFKPPAFDEGDGELLKHRIIISQMCGRIPLMIDQEVRDFKQKLIGENRQGLVLDIDETLSWTIGTWVEQLQKRFGNPENLSIKELAVKYRYTDRVPYWQTPEAFEWMEKAREDNKLQEEFIPILEAKEGVEKLQKIVPVLGYLTTRPRTVLEGTKRWLAKEGFPEVDVLARPAEVTSGEGDKWKAEVLNFLYPQVRGIVDDKLAVAEYLPKGYRGMVFLYNNSEANVKGIKVVSCPTWEVVCEQVRLALSVASG